MKGRNVAIGIAIAAVVVIGLILITALGQKRPAKSDARQKGAQAAKDF